MKPITCIIIEDEKASRITLKNYLSKYCSEISVVGEAANINEGYLLINNTKPNLVFLDIEMPFGNAFDLLEKYQKIPFEIVFITAYSQYAIKAINLSSCKYLLKPLNIDELVNAVTEVKKQINLKHQIKTSEILMENLSIENKQLKKIALPMLNGFEIIVLKDIIRCQANDNLTDFHLQNGQKITVCNTLKHYESTLSDFNFIRVHKSHLININYVKSYKKGSGGEIILQNLKSIPLSPIRKESFLNSLSNL